MEGNKVAHCLPKLAANSLHCVVWMEDILPSVFPFVQADLASLL